MAKTIEGTVCVERPPLSVTYAVVVAAHALGVWSPVWSPGVVSRPASGRSLVVDKLFFKQAATCC